MMASRGEIKIHTILQQNDINFKEEYSFPDLKTINGKFLRFDFAVFDDEGNLEFLIEYQGKQHYEAVGPFGGRKGFYQQKHNDDQKRRYCALHKIKLIEIPYTDYEIVSYDYIMQKAYGW